MDSEIYTLNILSNLKYVTFLTCSSIPKLIQILEEWNQVEFGLNSLNIYLRMLMTSLTAITATSNSLSSVMATMRSLNFDVNNSNLPFRSSDA